MIRHLAGSTLYWLCRTVDCAPWYDRRWYWRGQRGCTWGISQLAGKVYGE